MTDERAREKALLMYGSDDIEFDQNADVVHLTEAGPVQGAAWVKAWLFIPADEDDDDRRGARPYDPFAMRAEQRAKEKK